MSDAQPSWGMLDAVRAERDEAKAEIDRLRAVGPREVELAACGTYFLREPDAGDEWVDALAAAFAVRARKIGDS